MQVHYFHNHYAYKHILVEIHANFKPSLSISLGCEIRKYLPPLIILFFKNSTNFAKVNRSKINQNALIAEISICDKTSKFPK